MSLRLYFLLPDVSTAEQVEKELLLARIESRRMHFMAKKGVSLNDLPAANLAQTSDVVHGVETGIVTGGIAGIVVGFAGMAFLGLTAANSAMIAVIAVLGAGFGAWVSGLIAVSVPNSRLEKFTEQMDHGDVLLMLDISRERKNEVTEMVKKYHPDSDFGGVEPSIPAFP